jgi:hypothetical protein
MCVQVTKTANRFEISSLSEKILLKQVRAIPEKSVSWGAECHRYKIVLVEGKTAFEILLVGVYSITVVLAIEVWQTTSGLTIPSLYD